MSKLQEEIDMMYVILEDECSRLSKLQEAALKKGLWRDVYEYDAKKIEVKHLMDRFTKEINIA